MKPPPSKEPDWNQKLGFLLHFFFGDALQWLESAPFFLGLENKFLGFDPEIFQDGEGKIWTKNDYITQSELRHFMALISKLEKTDIPTPFFLKQTQPPHKHWFVASAFSQKINRQSFPTLKKCFPNLNSGDLGGGYPEESPTNLGEFPNRQFPSDFL